jgi:hypothetical protein
MDLHHRQSQLAISEEKKLMYPTDPAPEISKHAELSILGTAIQQLLTNNDTAKIHENQSREGAAELQKQREMRGEGIIVLCCNHYTVQSSTS